MFKKVQIPLLMPVEMEVDRFRKVAIRPMDVGTDMDGNDGTVGLVAHDATLRYTTRPVGCRLL